MHFRENDTAAPRRRFWNSRRLVSTSFRPKRAKEDTAGEAQLFYPSSPKHEHTTGGSGRSTQRSDGAGSVRTRRRWLLTSGPAPFCLCKPFSCKACSGTCAGARVSARFRDVAHFCRHGSDLCRPFYPRALRSAISDSRGWIRPGLAFTFPVSAPRFVKPRARWSGKRSREGAANTYSCRAETHVARRRRAPAICPCPAL